MRKRHRAAAARSGPHRLKQKRKTCSSCSVDYDMLMEILVRLPTKSVTRLKTVCKTWYSLISSQQFCRLHTLRCHKPPTSLILATSANDFHRRLYYSDPITQTSDKLRIIPFNIDLVITFQIVDCTNGLVLLCNHFHDYHIYNPATKQLKKISLTDNDEFINFNGAHLVFDPSKSPHYKIVCLRTHKSGKYKIQVFDSESGTWRVCVEPFDLQFGLKSVCVEFENLVYLMSHKHIYYFDISKNVSQLIECELPEHAKTYYYSHYNFSHPIQEFNGSIHYAALVVDDPGTLTGRACLWQLQVNEDGPKWLLKYQLEVHPLPGLCGELLTIVMETSTLLIRARGKYGSPGKIVAYNFLDRSYKELLDLEPRMSWVMVYRFGETLALP